MGYSGFSEWNPAAYGEIIVADCYRLADVPSAPELVIDIGANRGVFVAAVRNRWPSARVVAVEPNHENIAFLRSVLGHDQSVILHHAAMGGPGAVYWHETPGHCGNHSYQTPTRWLPEYSISSGEHRSRTQLPTFRLALLAAEIAAQETLIKIDCEGGECVLLEDQESFAALRAARRVVMELHWFAATKPLAYELAGRWAEAIVGLEETHDLAMTIGPSSGYAWFSKR